jgi:hypothetical protein
MDKRSSQIVDLFDAGLITPRTSGLGRVPAGSCGAYLDVRDAWEASLTDMPVGWASRDSMSIGGAEKHCQSVAIHARLGALAAASYGLRGWRGAGAAERRRRL